MGFQHSIQNHYSKFLIQNKMNFTENLLASAYRYYSRKKRIDAFFQAKLLLVIIQSLFLLLFLFLINEVFKLNIFNFLFSYKWLMLIFYAILFIGNFAYYSNDKIKTIVNEFEMKNKNEIRLWRFITILCTILPLILFFLFLKILHPV